MYLVTLPRFLCISGGLAEEVDEKTLHAAFIPFGDILDIQIPLDYETGIYHCDYSVGANCRALVLLQYRIFLLENWNLTF